MCLDLCYFILERVETWFGYFLPSLQCTSRRCNVLEAYCLVWRSQKEDTTSRSLKREKKHPARLKISISSLVDDFFEPFNRFWPLNQSLWVHHILLREIVICICSSFSYPFKKFLFSFFKVYFEFKIIFIIWRFYLMDKNLIKTNKNKESNTK